MDKYYIPNRLNWIDWAKTIAITLVVLGHIPQERGSFLVSYIVQFHMPLFFFISGYLTKKESFCKKTLKKYINSLIIPYFIYNAIFYPFWFVRYLYENTNIVILECVKPIIGVFLFQNTTPYSTPLYGVTWFLIALFTMKIIFAACSNLKYRNYIFLFLSIICSIAYIYNEFYRVTTDLVPVGIIKCLPFFVLGFVSKETNVITPLPKNNYLIIGLTCFAVSIFAFTFLRWNNNIPLYGLCFGAISISAIGVVICICKLLDSIHFPLITNLSIGTMVIMGLHGIIITTFNFLFSILCNIEKGITYSWYIAILLAIFYVLILYPLIIIFKNKYSFMLGKSIH